MSMLSNEKINFKSLEEKTFKEMMKLGRKIIQDELLEIKDFGLYSQGIVEMVTREITKKSYRETAKTISEDTDNTISHTAVINIVLKLGGKIKLYEEGKIEGAKEIFQLDMAHIQKKIYMAVSDE